MSIATCPDPDRLRDFSFGRIADEAASTIADHLDACPNCRETIVGLSQSDDLLLAALREPEACDPYSEEADYRRALQFVEAIGRSVSGDDVTTGPEKLAAATVAGFSPAAHASSSVAAAQATGPVPLQRLRDYELLEKLGQGGMGAVYKARHVRLKKIVAIKVLPNDRLADPGAVARFEREMEAVGKLDHPNIVRAMDAGEVDGTHFLVMEYVAGSDLSQLVRERGRLPIREACELVRQAAVGLQEAHEHGMVHRDIKPSNIMLAVGQAGSLPGKESRDRRQGTGDRGRGTESRAQPVVKILDMGLALLSEAHSPDARNLTSTGQMMGTIDYMAPEQGGDSHQVDIRADLYSLGATLYKLLTGEAPFSGEKYDTPVKKLMALATKAPPPVRSHRAEIPGALASLIDHLLAKDPDDRLETPEDVAEALAPFAAGADLQALVRQSEPSGKQEAVEHPENTGNHSTPKLISSAAADGPPEFGGSAVVPPTISVQPAAGASAHPGTTQKAAFDGRMPRWMQIAVACGGAGLAVLLGTIFYIQTGKSIVQIEINDPGIQVVLDHDGKAVIKGADKKHEIKVYPGNHGLTITRGDFSFETPKFELKRKELVVLKVEYLPGKVRVATSEGEVLVEGELNAYALQFDGQDDEVQIPTLALDGAKPFTIEAWFEIDAAAANGTKHTVFSTRNKSGRGFLKFEVGNRAQAIWIGGHFGKTFMCRGVGEDTPRGWVHAAVVAKPGEPPVMFANGKRLGPGIVTSPSVPEINRQTSAYLGVHKGREDNAAIERLRGRIGSVRISNSARYEGDFTPPPRLENDGAAVALYRFDEGAGDVLYDTSGNDHHGKIVGAKWVRAASSATPSQLVVKGDPGLDFDGVDDYVELPRLTTKKEGSITVEAWITPEAWEHTAILNAFGKRPFSLYTDKGVVGFWCMGNRIELPAPADLLGKPVHVAGVYDDVGLTVFLNGQPSPKVPPTVKTADESLMAYMGAQRDWEQDFLKLRGFFRGRIHAIRVTEAARYSQAFTPERNLEPDANTLAHYRFDEGQGDLLKDASGNNYHGKIVGAKWVQPEGEAVATEQELILKPNDKVEIPSLKIDRAEVYTFEGFFTPAVDKPGTTMTLIGTEYHGIAVEGGGHWQIGWVADAYHAAGWAPSRARHRTHVVGVHKADALLLFIDGKLEASHPIPVSSSQEIQLHLGGGFNGRMDEIRVSKGARYERDFPPLPPHTRFEPDEQTVALYHCDEGQGDVLRDSSGNNHHGKIVGAEWATIPAGESPAELKAGEVAIGTLTFDGKSYIDIPTLQFENADPLTFEAWVTPQNQGADGTLFHSVDAPGFHLTKKKAAWAIGNGGESVGWVPVEPGKRVHVAGIRDIRELRFYLDGKRIQSQELPEPLKMRLHGGRIGAMMGDSPAEFFQGDMDEFRLSKVARYTEDFVPAPKLEADENTIALYHFDEGMGDVLQDSSGNSHHGKIVGAKWGNLTVADEPSPGGELDLLGPVDVAFASGSKLKWKRDGDHLIATGAAESTKKEWWGLAFPSQFSGDYDIEIDFTQQGFYPLQFDLPLGDRAIRLDMSPAGGGLIIIEGQESHHSNTAATLKSSTLQTLIGKVRQRGDDVDISVTLDGIRLGQFSGQRSRISLPQWVTPLKDQFSFAGMGNLATASIEFHRAVVRRFEPSTAEPLPPPAAVAPFDAAQAKAHQEAWAKHLGMPLEKEVELPGNAKMNFVLIPPGEFLMGSTVEEQRKFLQESQASSNKDSFEFKWTHEHISSEGPQHRVRITKPFYLGKYEVTQAQWQAVMGSNPSHFKDNPTHPVESLTWDDLQPFLEKLNEKRLAAQSVFSLPTQAQWEYACRAGTVTYWHPGDRVEDLGQYGWFDSNSGGTTHAVGALEANSFGLHDMHGNVWECCADYYAADYYANSVLDDPGGDTKGPRRVVCGGAWQEPAAFCRSAMRTSVLPNLSFNDGGFRLALSINDLPPEGQIGNTIPPPTHSNSIGMKFVRVPKGNSWLGGGGGQPGSRAIVFKDDFYLGAFTVTQEEWQKVMGNNPAHFSRSGARKEAVKDIPDADLLRFPVEGVSFAEVQAFLARLNTIDGQPGWEYRLPTSDEWEYACRGGPLSDPAESAFSFYAGSPANDLPTDQANFGHKDGLNRTMKVGQFKPNKLDLYDLHGNVLEWCSDANTNEMGQETRLARGGSWNDPPGAAAGQLPFSPDVRYASLGLRVVRARVETAPVPAPAAAPLDVAPLDAAKAH